jgi:ATP-binding protein involved in chromosome partitioning
LSAGLPASYRDLMSDALLKETDPRSSSAELRHPGLAQVKAIVAFASAKGGTGKSTLVASIAAALALKSRKIGIADADLDAPSAAAMLGLPRVRMMSASGGVEAANGPFGIRIVANDPSVNLPPINFAAEDNTWENGVGQGEAGEFTSLDDLLSRARFGALDLLLVDLAPGFSNAVRLSQLVGRAGVVMVLPASGSAIGAVRRALEEARRKQVRIIGLIENMQGFYCGNCHSIRPLLPRLDVGALARDFSLPILGRVPFDSRLAESCDNGHLFIREYPDTPVAKLIKEAAAAVMAAASAAPPAAEVSLAEPDY